jgi:hypothetical protein
MWRFPARAVKITITRKLKQFDDFNIPFFKRISLEDSETLTNECAAVS